MVLDLFGAQPPAERKCSRCATVKSLAEFNRNSRGPGGYYPYCKACDKKKRLERQAFHLAKHDRLTEKKCKACKEVLPISRFTMHSTGRDGYQTRCESCRYRKYAEKEQKRMRTWRRENRREWLYIVAKGRAARKGFTFTMTIDDIPPIPAICPVFGFPMEFTDTAAHNTPSIERVESDRGYDGATDTKPNNIAIISNRANKLKSDATLAELEAICAWLRREYVARGLPLPPPPVLPPLPLPLMEMPERTLPRGKAGRPPKGVTL